MLILNGHDLAVDELVRIARSSAAAAPVGLSLGARERVAAAAEAFAAHHRAGRPIYGWSTGCGALDRASVAAADNARQQLNLLRSHASGVGAPMGRAEVRAMLVSRANVLAAGLSGIRLEVLDALIELVNRDVYPWVPEGGSVGASDLAPLAHAALVLAGEGRAFVGGTVVPGRVALERAGLQPVSLQGRDALALINGLGQTTGTGALAVADAARLIEACEVAVALTMTALGSLVDFLDPRLTEAKPHPGLIESAARLRALTVGLWPGPGLREPLSTRCAPQVIGAAREAVARAQKTLQIELNSVADNPTLFPDGWLTSTSGNPHGQAAAEALDGLATAVASLAVMSERRTARLLDPSQNGGLPAFLVHPDAGAGVNTGLMIPQYTAAALVAELRTRSAPPSLQSIPVSNGTEDHNSLSGLSARHAAWVVATAETVLAIELLTAAQAIDLALAAGRALPHGVATLHARVRERVPVMIEDRVLADDIEAVLALLREGGLRSAVDLDLAPKTARSGR